MQPRLILTLLTLLLAAPVLQAHTTAEAMAQAAQRFLASLDADQRQKAVFEFKNDERLNWHFIPKTRNGLSLKDLKPGQEPLAYALINSGLSHEGYAKATSIMSMEEILRQMESANPRMVRDPSLYFISIFGEPSTKATWGLRVEGHHLSLNFTVAHGKHVSATPSFMGTNPAEVRQGPRKGLRVLGVEEELARDLVKALPADQRKEAIFNETAPKDIITMADRKVKPLETAGVAAHTLAPAQRTQLTTLVKEYLFRARPDVAERDLQAIEKSGWDKVRFAWAGSVERGQPHYYRVQGPTFLLEYDNTQNDANHVHAVWRDFDGDFGEDLLKKHYAETPHQ